MESKIDRERERETLDKCEEYNQVKLRAEETEEDEEKG